MFEFSEKWIPPGQYAFPFSLTLPDNLPNSFQYKKDGGNYKIYYRIKVFFDSEDSAFL